MFKNIKDFFSKKSIEKKSFSPLVGFANYLIQNGWTNLSAYQSLLYFMKVSPLFDAITRITDEAASVSLFVQNKKSEKYDNSHEVLSLLRKPNTDVCSIELMEELISYFLITGNAYALSTGKRDKPPLEVFAVSPEFITLIPDERDGYTRTIQYSSSARAVAFHREEIKGRFRFYSEDGLQELWQIRSFNPIKGTNNNYGLSRATPIFYDVEQYLSASVHNLSLLKRGGRPSGAFSTDEALEDTQWARLQEEMKRYIQGAENAGEILILDNGLKYNELSLSNKDMDFEKLMTRIVTQVYNTYKIPLPLIAPGQMTYDNLATARLMLYDLAVLPVLKRVLQELSEFLMYRYKKADTEIVYNPYSIPALQLRLGQELSMKKNVGIYTINELRAISGDDRITGGDDVYSQSGYPIASSNLSTLRDEEEEGSLQEESSNPDKGLVLDYITRAKKIKNNRGLPAFSEKELITLGKRYGLSSKTRR